MQNQHTLFVGEMEPEAKAKPHIILPPPKVEPLLDVFADAMLESSFEHHRRGAAEPMAKAGPHLILPPPKVQPLHEMFADAMLEDATAHHRRGAVESAAAQGPHIVLPPPKGAPPQEVFAEAILENTSAHQRRSPLDWAVSIGLHAAVLSALLIAPLYFTTGLDFHKLNVMFLAPPAMPAAPPPPMAATVVARRAPSTPARFFVAGKLTVPTMIPKTIDTTPEAPLAAPEDAFGGVPGGVPGGQVGGVLGGVLGGLGKSVPPPAPAVAAGPKVPVRVGGDVKPPRLLFAPDPIYPVLARQSHLGGVVIIEAIIDEHGKVTGMRVVSGHPLLIPSAIEAVSQRRYEPTILDGEPTPIDLRVEIKFSFS